MRDYYCAFTAQMDPVSGSRLSDRTYRGEMDVRADNALHARDEVAKRLAETNPGDKLLDCSCKAF